MSRDDRPLGRYYHEVYLAPEPMRDESRDFRIKYAYLLRSMNAWELSHFVVGETAVETFKPGMRTPEFREAILGLSWLDLLRVLHAVVLYVGRQEQTTYHSRGSTELHIRDVQRLFQTERLNWEMDSRGGIHPLRDAAYSIQRQSVIAGLTDPRFANAAAAFQRFVDAYDSATQDNKLAINHIFDTAEALFKLRYQPTPPERLDKGEIGSRLREQFPRPDGTDVHSPDKYVKRANNEMVEGFVRWCEAAQQFRHEKGVPDQVDQPPNDITELIVSIGMGYIRWLLRIHPR